MVLGPANLGDFGSHDFTDHLTDVTTREVAKDLAGFGRRNLPKRLQKANFIYDGLLVGCNRRKLKDCEGQIWPSGRASFNYQQLLGRFLKLYLLGGRTITT